MLPSRNRKQYCTCMYMLPLTAMYVFAANLSLPPSRHVYMPEWCGSDGENCNVLEYLLPFCVTLDTIAPDGSGELTVKPKNHSKLG